MDQSKASPTILLRLRLRSPGLMLPLLTRICIDLTGAMPPTMLTRADEVIE
jgi:hypothetical protein